MLYIDSIGFIPILSISIILIAALTLLSALSGKLSIFLRLQFISPVVLSIFILIYFIFLHSGSYRYSLYETYGWMEFLGINLTLGLDHLSAVFILITCLAFLFSLFLAFREDKEILRWKVFFYALIFLGLVLMFLAVDLVLFYFGWEVAVFSTYFALRLNEGKKSKVSGKFIFYSLASSFCLLTAIVLLSYNFQTGENSFSLIDITELKPTQDYSGLFIFSLLFVSFAIKVPLFPFHLWMPDTYESAPYSLTLLMSAAMSKMGIYGILRILYPLFAPLINEGKTSMVYLALIGLVYASLAAIGSKQIKRVLAYSSMAHLALICAGIFSLSSISLEGGLFQSLNHTLVSILLFFVLGNIIINLGGQTLKGIWNKSPVATGLFMAAAFANVALPGTANFVGELKLLLGLYSANSLFAFIGISGSVLSAIYMLGTVRDNFFGDSDIIIPEIPKSTVIISSFLLILIIFLGVYPAAFDYSFGNSFSDFVRRFQLSVPGLGV